MNSQAKAGPSVIHLEGTQPGLLDKSQRSRLLRVPNATLSFAAFDPYLATSRDPPDLSKLSLDDDHCRTRRIVVETVPGRGSFWRWVPTARKQEGVVDEGTFPRLIDVGGQPCFCSQEQWDIYKLDPVYDCYVKLPPALTVIVAKDSVPSSSPSLAEENNNIAEDDESDAEKMIIDDDIPLPRPQRKRKLPPHAPSQSNDGISQKRRAHLSFQSLRFPEEENEFLEVDWKTRNTKLYEPKNQKRTRTVSPNTGKRAADVHRNKHETMKRARVKQEMEARREIRDRKFMGEVLCEVPPCSAQFNEAASDGTHHSGAKGDLRDDHEDLVAVSHRRMSELNAHRDYERSRERQLGTSDDTRPQRRKQPDPNHHEDKDKRGTAEEEKDAQGLQERRRHEENERWRADMLKRLERERIQRHEQWNQGPWTMARAIERYKLTASFFDTANYSVESFPLAFIDIPWPTLRHPLLNRPEDIDWESTGQFFQIIQQSLRGQEYKSFLKASLQRFHPDRWSGRNLFTAILFEDERNEIETAVNTVSKALGSLYAEARSIHVS